MWFVWYRLFEAFFYRLSVPFVDSYGVEWGLQSRNRSLILLMINYFEMVIPPFLMGFISRIQAAFLNFCIGVIPPIPMLGRSLLYVQSQAVA